MLHLYYYVGFFRSACFDDSFCRSTADRSCSTCIGLSCCRYQMVLSLVEEIDVAVSPCLTGQVKFLGGYGMSLSLLISAGVSSF